MRGTLYQLFLILLLALVAALFGVFLYWEVFPEYKIYQHAYVALEDFRATLTHEVPPAFEYGVKQIVIPRADGGPETIDRCTSCHVALQIDAFSPTAIARDINGEVIRDDNGMPLKIPNEQYVFHQLDDKIRSLTDKEANDQLLAQGDAWKVDDNLRQAERLKALRTASVEGYTVDMKKVLVMHPLIGNELRPFEYHSPDEIGCTACHNGNGRALTAAKAHGPVFDGEYEPAFEGEKPQFLESDPRTDPPFSRVFNHKPGHELLFQTTPLFVGGLIEANCIQCHLSSTSQLKGAISSLSNLKDEGMRKGKWLEKTYSESRNALVALLEVRRAIEEDGIEGALKQLQQASQNFTLPQREREEMTARGRYIRSAMAGVSKEQQVQQLLIVLQNDIIALLGSPTLAKQLEKQLTATHDDPQEIVQAFVDANRSDEGASGRLFLEAAAIKRHEQTIQTLDQANASVGDIVQEKRLHASLSDIDLMTKTYQHGQEFFLSQACYACHRIAGFSRGGVGPDLTQEGLVYPWYIKQKLVWPQGDFRESTMPEMRLDHGELEALVTFLLGQRGRTQAVSDVAYQVGIKQWESGKKLPWEEPLKPDQIHDLDVSMTIFATEGCAACHRLHGFKSDVGFAIEKGGSASLEALNSEREWFHQLVPELVGGSDIPGSAIIRVLEEHGDEIDRRIIADARQGSLLEKIEAHQPGLLQSFYSNFEFALRHHTGEGSAVNQKQWRDRVWRVLLMYIQEYGLGRLIGPRPNWSGIYRSDQWLMEHFHDPSSHTAKSLMPVFPFDETKFAALTYMLDILGRRNLEFTHARWQQSGFQPAEAFQIHCAQCHGMSERRDEAPVLPWIYPLPKNLRNATFLRNLTRPRIMESITHGVKGTPMPPWGETPQDKPFDNNTPVLRPNEVIRLADWLFRSLPGEATRPNDVPKWQYTPEDVIQEMQREGDTLKAGISETESNSHSLYTLFPKGEGLLAALYPKKLKSWHLGMEPKVSPVNDVLNLFDIRTNPVAGGVDQKAYYIRQKYYTPQNVEAGRHLFQENCAVCHGSEGAGDGARAGEMEEAKPRMFTNVIWQETRDDLRLLRSIKYGVPGTAMTPWGDLTSTLQRLQLVMYIRSLARPIEAQRQLAETLYSVFDVAAEEIRQARIAQYAFVDEALVAYNQAKAAREALDRQLSRNASETQAVVEAYEKEANLLKVLKERQSSDLFYQELMDEVNAEKGRFEREGKALLNAQTEPKIFDGYLKLIAADEGRYRTSEGKLQMVNGDVEQRINEALAALEQLLDQSAGEIRMQKDRIQGRINSPQQRTQIAELESKNKNLTQLKNELIALVSDDARARAKQKKIFDRLQLSNDKDKDMK